MDFFLALSHTWIFQYPVCMDWSSLFLYSPYNSCFLGQEVVLPALLRQRTAFSTNRMKLRTFKKKRRTAMDEIKNIPLWISHIFLCNVLHHALVHLSGIFRRTGSESGCYTDMDIQTSMALGLSRYIIPSGGSSVCFRFLQCNAYLHCTGNAYHDIIQTTIMVRILPDGDYDSINM